MPAFRYGGGRFNSDTPWERYIRESTELFEVNLDKANQLPRDFEACTLCAARSGMDPRFKGQSRAILYYRDRGHAVLGVGNDINSMTIIDESPFASVMGGSNISIQEYNNTMGRPEWYGILETRRAIDDVIQERGRDGY